MPDGQETVNESVESNNKFGFIVMDGNGTLFGKLTGNRSEVLHQSTVNQIEDPRNYVRRMAELATRFFIDPETCQANISGLILASVTWDLKAELSRYDMFDPRLDSKILRDVLDVSNGGDVGFNQAINLSPHIREDVKYFQEQRLLTRFMLGLSYDARKYVVGVEQTLDSLEMGAVDILIIWEKIDMNRYVLRNNITGEIVVKHLNKIQEGDESFFRDFDTNAELVVEEKMSLLDWLPNECIKYGCTLEVVTDETSDGAAFCFSFGIGAILLFQLDIEDEGEISD